ncbi:hypothetical protein UFOVP442_3 [uncultured Caudovirales phage]|uniref:Uncharacterized protein n=3 Tax=uncultured Caudovirales phage TaxID=2100421 RepID=A0A6J5M7Z0_9CAUD|nr:hypothetical protein UFOVP442_3 [uncultured Caudovirales phage]
MSGNKLSPIMAWHASPFDIPDGKFGEMQKVSGTGQGAASFGRGAAYVAESPTVSGPGKSSYMEEFANHPAVSEYGAPNLRFNGINLQELHKAKTQDYDRYLKLLDLSSLNRSPHLIDNLHDFLNVYNEAHSDPLYERPENLTEAFSHFRRHKLEGEYYTDKNSQQEDIDAQNKFVIEDSAELWDKVLKYTTPYTENEYRGPYSYQVAVHLTPETILDWDAALKDHHPNAKEKILKAFNDPIAAEEWGNAFQTGAVVYRQLQSNYKSDFDASEALYNAGIHGIKYLDRGSRQGPTVMFKDKPLIPDGSTYDPAISEVNLRLLANSGDIDLSIEHMKERMDQFPGTKPAMEKAINWLNENRKHIKMVNATYNYVIFHPDFVQALSQYNINGEKTKDFGPGVHLKSVEHDPFKDEGK